MNRHELQIKRELFLRELKALNAITVECYTCEHYASVGPSCTRHQATPPDSVVKAGCDDWLHDPIPF